MDEQSIDEQIQNEEVWKNCPYRFCWFRMTESSLPSICIHQNFKNSKFQNYVLTIYLIGCFLAMFPYMRPKTHTLSPLNLALKMLTISASADGGPRSRVCARETLRSTPIDTSGNFPRTCLQSNLQNFHKKTLKTLKIAPGGPGGGVKFCFTRIFVYTS